MEIGRFSVTTFAGAIPPENISNICKTLNIHGIKIWPFSKIDLLASFNFGGFSILKLLSICIGATFKGQNMLPVGSIFFTLMVAPSSTLKHSPLQNVLFVFLTSY